MVLGRFVLSEININLKNINRGTLMKSLIQRQEYKAITVLGTTFHKLRVKDLINYVISQASLPQKTVVGNVNVRAMNFAYDLPWYRKFLNQSDLVFCDGFGVLLGAKCCGHSLDSTHRMTCPDFIEDLAQACASTNTSIYLLAGKPGVVDQAIQKLTQIAPSLDIQGHHGYFDKQGLENDRIIQAINQFQPDILYVGFGMPLQEQWIVDNMDRIDAKVFLPLGACLDFYTGTIDRGPKILTNMGLEWLTRLFTEPRRLWSRYMIGNPLFFYRLFKNFLTTRFSRR
jgi:N-acetylglucosaminyldiphosphoundecaprenol N-acetyl-beta-D-mannosaminyltransferase